MIMDINGVSPEEIEGAIISSVVPPLTKILPSGSPIQNNQKRGACRGSGD